MLLQLSVTISFIAGMQKCWPLDGRELAHLALNFWKHAALISVSMITPTFVSHFFAFCHCSCKLCKMKPLRTFCSCFGVNVKQVSTRAWTANELLHCAVLDCVSNMLVVCWVALLVGRSMQPFVDLGQECTFCPLFYNEFIHWSLWTFLCLWWQWLCSFSRRCILQKLALPVDGCLPAGVRILIFLVEKFFPSS